MSAFIVDRAHIDALVQGLCESELVIEDPTLVGRTLWLENLLSLQALYPRDKSGERPGPADFEDGDVVDYVYRRPTATISQSTLLDAAACFVYQTCEHDGWMTSHVRQWLDLLEASLITAGVKRGDDWSLTEADVHPATVSA